MTPWLHQSTIVYFITVPSNSIGLWSDPTTSFVFLFPICYDVIVRVILAANSAGHRAVIKGCRFHAFFLATIICFSDPLTIRVSGLTSNRIVVIVCADDCGHAWRHGWLLSRWFGGGRSWQTSWSFSRNWGLSLYRGSCGSGSGNDWRKSGRFTKQTRLAEATAERACIPYHSTTSPDIAVSSLPSIIACQPRATYHFIFIEEFKFVGGFINAANAACLWTICGNPFNSAHSLLALGEDANVLTRSISIRVELSESTTIDALVLSLSEKRQKSDDREGCDGGEYLVFHFKIGEMKIACKICVSFPVLARFCLLILSSGAASHFWMVCNYYSCKKRCLDSAILHLLT